MKRRAVLRPRCRFVPQLEQLEDRTVLNVASGSTVPPVPNAAPAVEVTFSAYPLSPQPLLEMADTGYDNLGFQESVTNLTTTGSSSPPGLIVTGRLGTSPTAVWLWEGLSTADGSSSSQGLILIGRLPASPPSQWLWDGSRGAEPDAAGGVVGMADRLFNSAQFLMPIPGHPTPEPTPVPTQIDVSTVGAEHSVGTQTITALFASRSNAIASFGASGLVSSGAEPFATPVSYFADSPVVIREPANGEPTVTTFRQDRTADGDLLVCVLREDAATAPASADHSSDVLPFVVTVAPPSIVAQSEEMAPTSLAPLSRSEGQFVQFEYDTQVLPSSAVRDQTGSLTARSDEREGSLYGYWPAWVSAGGLLLVLYRKAVAAWRKRRRTLPS